MINKSRKLIALLLMVALVVTYTFGANLSVFAEEPQGDANAKTSASESADPAPATGDTAKEEPAPAPAPSEGVGETGGGEPAANNDQEGEEEVNVEGEVLKKDSGAVQKEDAAVKQVNNPVERSLNTNQSFTCNTAFPPHNHSQHEWSLEGADGFYDWNANSHRITNRNYTAEEKVVTITHTITHRNGSVDKESWIITLVRDTIVNINYYAGRDDIAHTQAATQHAQTTIWGVPEREGFMFIGWALREPAPGSNHVDFSPGQSVVPRDYSRYISYNNRIGTWNLYAVWKESPADDLKPVTGNSKTLPYNGAEQTVYGITKAPDQESGFVAIGHVTSGPPGHQITITYYIKAEDVYAKGTDVGEYQTAVEYARVYSHSSLNHGGDPSVTDMYVKVNPGKLTITALPVTIDVTVTLDREPVITKPYTGEQYIVTFNTVKLDTENEVLLSEWEDPSWTGQRHDLWVQGTDAGEYYTKVKDTLNSYDLGENVNPDNYVITFNVIQGTLVIEGTPMPKFTVANYDAVYDGNYHTVTVNTRDLPEGYELSYSQTGEEAGTWTKDAPTWKDVELTDSRPAEPISHPVYVKATCKNYAPLIVEGTVTIRPRPVTVDVDVTSNGESTVTKPYNEQDQVIWFSDISYGTKDKVLDREWNPQFSGNRNEYLAKGKEVGKYDTHVGADMTSHTLGGDALAINYDITFNVTQGTLVIESAPMPKFTVANYDAVYDGNYHTVTVNTRDLPEGYELSYSQTGEEAGTWTKDAPTWKDVELTDSRPAEPISHPVYVKATCKNYAPLIVEGTVTIRPRPVTVDVTVTLDGEPVITKPYTGEQYIVTFNTVKLDTENEVLLSEWEDPSWTGQRHDLWVQGTDAGEYYTKVKDTLDSYDLGENVNPDNYDITFNVIQGTLEIYSEPATLTFKLNGGNVGGNTDDIVVEANTGDVITIIDAPARDGYEFQYWEGSKYYPGDEYKVMGDHTFTAVWAKIDNGGGNDDSDDDSDDSDNNKKGKDGNGSSTGDEVGLIGIMALLAASIFGLYALTALRRREE